MVGKANRPRATPMNKILNKQVIKPESHELDEEGKKVLSMLTALEDEDSLNNWEMGFVSDVATRFYNGKSLHPNSFKKLEEVYRKYN